DGSVGQLADAFGLVHACDRDWCPLAEHSLDVRQDLFKKPDDRITIWALLFVNRANEKEAISFTETARCRRGSKRVANNANAFDAVLTELFSVAFRNCYDAVRHGCETHLFFE